MFSICLCSWNDLNYLKLLHHSIKKYTKLPYEFIVHDNGSEDGTLEWLKSNNIKYSRGEKNEGVAAVNYAADMAKFDYIVDINADMFVLPGWDIEILKYINQFKKNKIDKFTVSSRLIEPVGNNPEYVISYHGHDYSTFNEQSLLEFYSKNINSITTHNTNQYSHPICVPRNMWKEFGGVDFRYQYGIATDHDIPASAYNVGCRNFLMIGKPTVFHFSCKTVSKLPTKREDGQQTFINKWGFSIQDFRKKLKIGQKFEQVE